MVRHDYCARDGIGPCVFCRLKSSICADGAACRLFAVNDEKKPRLVRISLCNVALTRAMCSPGSLDSRIARDMGYIRSNIMRGDSLFMSMMADGGMSGNPRPAFDSRHEPCRNSASNEKQRFFLYRRKKLGSIPIVLLTRKLSGCQLPTISFPGTYLSCSRMTGAATRQVASIYSEGLFRKPKSFGSTRLDCARLASTCTISRGPCRSCAPGFAPVRGSEEYPVRAQSTAPQMALASPPAKMPSPPISSARSCGLLFGAPDLPRSIIACSRVQCTRRCGMWPPASNQSW